MSMRAASTSSFSALRAYLWPIHSWELRKFLPLFLMGFFIGFNYNILRNMKDALLLTAESSGAEVIPFVKVWGIVPGAFLMTYLYSRLNNRMSRDQLFYAMILIFLGFFAVFTFLIFPHSHKLHLNQTADFLQQVLPSGCKGMIAMVRYWTFSSFYIMSELWSSTILSVLFYGFLNEVIHLGEAKRFYGLIAVGLNISTISAGQVAYFLCGNFCHSLFHFKQNPWEDTLILLTIVVLFSGFAILGIYHYLSKNVLREQAHVHASWLEKGTIRMSMKENFAILAKSKYLFCIAVIVLSYNIIIVLQEVLWKDQVKQLYPSPNDFAAYMGQVTTVTGIISFFTSLLVSGQSIRKLGWTFTALLTPGILLLTSIGFFGFFFDNKTVAGVLSMLGTSPLAIVVFFGSFQNCLCRAAKYTVFDATKEMAFIPLNTETKLKGKAAIDGVGSRLGKSGGSLIYQGLLLSFSSLAACVPIVACVLFAVIVGWIGAAWSLGKQFQVLSGKPKEAEPILKGDNQKEAISEEQEVAVQDSAGLSTS